MAEMLSQSLRPVGLGLVAGCGLAAALGIVLMSVAYAASLLLILAACAPAALIPALRAARIEPSRSLRQD